MNWLDEAERRIESAPQVASSFAHEYLDGIVRRNLVVVGNRTFGVNHAIYGPSLHVSEGHLATMWQDLDHRNYLDGFFVSVSYDKFGTPTEISCWSVGIRDNAPPIVTQSIDIEWRNEGELRDMLIELFFGVDVPDIDDEDEMLGDNGEDQ